ncbi:type II toxin-antitoxin system VapC family toxin [Candidatus Synechococcus calcipolaris G9]|uniref:Type II toxin-antitoxin system VapC family toxin n=1 Tax=Candidatus Synechococcus calcipolaris G9 TaxID=1497997 RepID=A0ABT6F0F2_9SYNE|nr:type II toxin-antitoxin system VapC family toxin [Candidatus Synechococcus calcipolaris]MDG2991341.1 type II toxin-antitoxin system VapC family toxin [Candidatus Synechococcus calcipolaris G9]
MTGYVLDTNVVMRFCNSSDVQHKLATDAVSPLLMQSDECFLVAQVIIEFWAVATRPPQVNGLGWSVEQTRSTIDQLLDRFPSLEESPQLFPTWLNLVTTHRVMGKRTHDARIIAAILANGITHLLTFNPSDFAGMSGITIIHPQDLSLFDTDDL